MRGSLVARQARAGAVLVSLALSASACQTGGGTEGELGNGRFFYECVAADDIFCSELNPDPPFDASEPAEVPDSVVVGSRFALAFDLDETVDASVSVEVDCAVDAFEEQQHFRPTREGWLAFVAERDDGVVADLIHVLVTTPERIDFASERLTLDGGVELTATTNVAAIPYGSSGQVLFGGFEATWASSDESVVVVQAGGAPTPPRGAIATLVPGAPGDAIVTVTVAGVEQQLAVTVPDEVFP